MNKAISLAKNSVHPSLLLEKETKGLKESRKETFSSNNFILLLMKKNFTSSNKFGRIHESMPSILNKINHPSLKNIKPS